MTTTSRVLEDLQAMRDIPEIVICARRSPVRCDIDLTETQELMEEADRRARVRRFSGAALTGWVAL
jgi:hypothetical protein